MSAAKQYDTITTIDPDSGLPVEIVLLKMENGAIVGIDASFIDQDVGPVLSPYDEGDVLEFD